MTHPIAHSRRTATGALTGALLSTCLLTLGLPAHAADPVRVTLSTSAGDIRLELYPAPDGVLIVARWRPFARPAPRRPLRRAPSH